MKVNIADGNFTTCSMGAAPDSCPKYFEWEHVPGDVPARFYTDWCMKYAINKPGMKIAWLIQAPPFAQEHYDYAKEHEADFDYILTPCKQYVGGKWLWYPLGGTRIALKDWYVHPKIKKVSMLASNKFDSRGHKLRHEIYLGHLGCVKFDGYGSILPNQPTDKLTAIAPYMYSIVVAAERNAGCFSDHLIDALALGTVPIYWGCPDVENYFDKEGIISFEKAGELDEILAGLSTTDFVKRLPAVRKNLETAKQYRVPEDWLWENYRFIFGEE